MKFTITVTVTIDTDACICRIEEYNADTVEYNLAMDSYESIADSAAEALSDYLHGIG